METWQAESVFMPDSGIKQYMAIGISLIFLGLAATLSGEALGRFGRTIRRSEQPTAFWGIVAVYYLGGICGVLYFLYEFALS